MSTLRVDNITNEDGSGPPNIDLGSFDSGTRMLFHQSTAPTGWTKDTTHNNKAMRVVSGTVSSGGSVEFTSVFASGLSSGGTTLTNAQIPSHTHTFSTNTSNLTGRFAFTDDNSTYMAVRLRSANGVFRSWRFRTNHCNSSGVPGQRTVGSGVIMDASHSHSGTTDGSGSGESHNHTLPSFDVQYVDFIIAIRD